MPLIQIFTSAAPPAAATKDALVADLSRLLSQTFNKPERWSMICLLPNVSLSFGGDAAPSAFVAVRNVGKMSPTQTEAVSAALCARLKEALGVPADRTFIEFRDVEDHMWGWNGGTFA